MCGLFAIIRLTARTLDVSMATSGSKSLPLLDAVNVATNDSERPEPEDEENQVLPLAEHVYDLHTHAYTGKARRIGRRLSTATAHSIRSDEAHAFRKPRLLALHGAASNSDISRRQLKNLCIDETLFEIHCEPKSLETHST